MSTEKKAPAGSSTKDLARTLGKKELMGIAIGQIIGAGIMSMMGVAIAMTGRSANLAFMLSAVFTMCTFFPSIFITSCIRMRGGMYTQMAIFAGDKWAGYYSVVYFITNMSLAMYALSFAQYALALLPTGGSQKVIALVVGTLFFILNYFGVDLMAKIQNLLVIVLLLSLTIFAVFGLPQVDLANYFSNADGLFMTDGIGGFLTAVAYLGFATGGATVILGVSAECKNPTKDIPFVIVTSTIGVAILYGLVATTASGVLPVAEVANQPLTLVAAEVLPKPLYIFFIVGGAMFALATTLNSQIMSCTKPVMQSCEDGWDYTIYHSDYSVMDGGQLGAPELTIQEAREQILEAHHMEKGRRLLQDYDAVMDKVAEAEELSADHRPSTLEKLAELASDTSAPKSSARSAPEL